MTMSNNIERLKGTWDYVNGDNNDEYLKELGVGMMERMMAKGLKPQLIISEKDGKWTLCTKTIFKTITLEFTPDVEYEETTPDGRQIKGIVRFEDGKWIQKMRNQTNKESMITRWVDTNDQLRIMSECGKAKVHKLYKRVQ
ncbi:unnamed protein product [Rotaria sp. Silwood2]|nr:unnamed protein product [Rotaria sp. Silwood2]CAF3271223.1 unnamed protein product [Rotaria sp. Silwood2]CAF4213474.1 unnamed protein product [Rotaria sp. Silwood2]CAF4235428.1 unnamed protein product [Rotaria sp. Silwood2]CAF4256487.1 unnamed protein product [Rotaria sp. Silwood2]